MNGFTANAITPADCFTKVLAGSAFPSVSMHVLIQSREATMPVDDQAAYCDNVMIPKYSTAADATDAIPYGTDSGISIEPALKFDLADVSTWDQFMITPYPSQPAYTVKFYGPRFKSSSTYIRLTKRDQITHPFENLSNVNWVDATDNTWGQDWLGNLMPGGWCYVNRGVSEPMTGVSYWEDARKNSDPPNIIDRTSATTIHQNWMPFCTPITAYNLAGSALGTFDGLAFMVFWNLAAVKNPRNPPDDAVYQGPILPVPPLSPYKQLLSFEVWIYLTANPTTAGTFKSPRIARVRYWTYTRTRGEGGTGGTLPFDPYLFFNASVGPTSSLMIPVTFQLLDNGNNPTHLTSKLQYIALSGLKFVVGA